MNNFDSLKIGFPAELMTYSGKHFEKRIVENYTGEIKSNFSFLDPVYKITGLNNIILQPDKCILEISSKLIPGEYSNMIRTSNIADYLNKVNESGYISFNTAEVIKNASVFKCDVTNNILFKDTKPAEVLNLLTAYVINDKYNCRVYAGETLLFERKAKTKSLQERLTVYSKYPELCRKANAEFSKEIDKEYFRQVLRFESRFSNLAMIRRAFNVKDTNLISVLESPEKINYDIFSRVTDIPNEKTESFENTKLLFEMKKQYSNSQIEKKLGRLNILILSNYNIDIVKAYFSINSTANNSRYIREYKKLMKGLENKKSDNAINNLTADIKAKLVA